MVPNPFLLDVNDVRLGLMLAQCIANLRVEQGVLAIRRVLTESTGLSCRTLELPPSSVTPRAMFCQLGSKTIILLDGAVLGSQVTGLMGGFDPNFLDSVSDAVNRYTNDATNILYQAANSNGFPFTDSVIWAGWSLGGTVAATMAERNATVINATANRKVVTFGAPMTGGRSFIQAMSAIPVVRYMTRGDWVPLIPAFIYSSLWSNPFIPLRRYWSYASYGHCQGGVLVETDGAVSAATRPPDAVIPPFSSLVGAWLENNLPTTEHAIQVFVNRLTAAVELMTPAVPSYSPDTSGSAVGGGYDAPEAPSLPPPMTDHNLIRRRVDAGDAALRAQGAAQDIPVVVIPTVRQFQAVRVGRTWGVVFNGEPVAAAPTKRRARALARTGNSMLRHTLLQSFVDPLAFAQQFSDFLTVAAIPGNGFDPPLQDELPNVPPTA